MNPMLHPVHPGSPLHPGMTTYGAVLPAWWEVALAALATLAFLALAGRLLPVRRASALVLLLALALPASAQQFGVGGQVVSGGVTQQWFGYGKANGTSGPGVYMTPPKGCVGWWDPANAVWGGKRGGGTDDFADADAATPVTEASYPIVIYGWGFCDNPATASACLLQFSNSDGTESFSVAVSVTGYLRALSTDGGVAAEANTAASAIDATTPFRYIAVFESTTSRAIYCDQDTTGGTNTTSSSPAGIDRTRFFGWRDGTTDWLGNAGPTHVFANATVPSSDQRTAFLRDGHDPEVIQGTRATALWMSGSAPLTDQRGSVNLSVDGNSVADTDDLWSVPDRSGQNNALFWAKSIGATNAPSRITSVLNGHASGDYTASSSNSGLRTATDRTPITAEPAQIYMVVDVDAKVNSDVMAEIGDDAGAGNYWRLTMSATVFQAGCNGASAGAVTADSLAFTINTGYLVWGGFAAANSRTCETNGGDQGTNSTSRTVSGIDHVGVMSYQGNSSSASTDGQLGLVIILNTSSTAGQPSIERFTSAAYALGF